MWLFSMPALFFLFSFSNFKNLLFHKMLLNCNKGSDKVKIQRLRLVSWHSSLQSSTRFFCERQSWWGWQYKWHCCILAKKNCLFWNYLNSGFKVDRSLYTELYFLSSTWPWCLKVTVKKWFSFILEEGRVQSGGLETQYCYVWLSLLLLGTTPPSY